MQSSQWTHGAPGSRILPGDERRTCPASEHPRRFAATYQGAAACDRLLLADTCRRCIIRPMSDTATRFDVVAGLSSSRGSLSFTAQFERS